MDNEKARFFGELSRHGVFTTRPAAMRALRLHGIGPGTETIAAEGQIVTPGAIDSHIHFICPQQVDEALMSSVTTMLGGGT